MAPTLSPRLTHEQLSRWLDLGLPGSDIGPSQTAASERLPGSMLDRRVGPRDLLAYGAPQLRVRVVRSSWTDDKCESSGKSLNREEAMILAVLGYGEYLSEVREMASESKWRIHQLRSDILALQP